jgi:hypothetical protein
VADADCSERKVLLAGFVAWWLMLIVLREKYCWLVAGGWFGSERKVLLAGCWRPVCYWRKV